MENPDRAGQLTREYFNDPDLDPWIRESRDPLHPNRRDAFCGNGIIGLRVPAAGEPSIYPETICGDMVPGGTLMYHVLDENSLIPMFNFLGLVLKEGDTEFRRDTANWRNFRQTLDWRTGIVRTVCDWTRPGGSIRVETEIRLSRARRNLGIVHTTATPDFPCALHFTDSVDGTFLEMLSGAATFPRAPKSDRIRTFYAETGPFRRLVAASTVLECVPQPETPERFTATGAGFRRETTFRALPGQTVSVRKFAALVSEHDSPDPVNSSRMLAAAAADDPASERSSHFEAWRRLWESDIEVDHPGLQMVIHASLYALYCCLAESTEAVPGPTGLAGNAWGGRIFWDDDLWMFPPVALLHPELGRNFVDYRFKTLPGAKRNAAARGLEGAQFAWESAETGDETIPGLIYARQHHVNSDVALAAWQYFLISGDKTYLEEKGAEIIVESARFWASRVTWNGGKNRYEIHGVCCADENAGIRNNNALTNYGAAHTLRLAGRVAEMTGRPVDPRWNEIADKLWIPSDPESGRIIEHDTYSGETIKQADAALLIYPYGIKLSASARRATIDYYKSRYPENKIMMGSAIDGIIAAELGDVKEAWEALLDTLPHFHAPFLLASESPVNDRFCFMTGLGGVLQLILMGFGGIRITPEGITATPHLPEALSRMNVRGLHFRGERFDLEVGPDGVRRI